MHNDILPLLQHLWLSLQAALPEVLSFGASLLTQLLQTIIVTWLLQQWADWRVRETNLVTIHQGEEETAHNQRQ
jgi:hypothetical protein